MPKCYYKGCGSRRGQVRYRPFPKPTRNMAQTLLWLQNCANEKLNIDNISQNVYVCDRHFVSGNDVPTAYYPTLSGDSLEVASYVEVPSAKCLDQYEKILKSLDNSFHELDKGTDHIYASSFTKMLGAPNISRLIMSEGIKSTPSHQLDKYKHFFNFDSFSTNKHFEYFTGLSIEGFRALYNLLDPSVMPSLKYTVKARTPTKLKSLWHLSNEDKLCMTLIRIKKGYSLKELSIFYNISIAHVSRIFHTWVQFIYLQSCCMRNAFFKGSRDTIRYHMPACFRAFEEKITIILDSTEIKMEMSRNFQRQGNTHSNYKHQNSVKFLVGVSSRGAIVYNSEGFEGAISDNELFNSSDIEVFLQEDDVIMVDRGFTIQDICDKKKYKLIIPPFLAGRSKLTAEEELLTKKIAKCRIHVERSIQRIKMYQILSKPIKISILPLISNIFSIICFVVNFEKPLVN
ncbi:hypothetical protein RI129_009767 [Pyrocoelia pectoralis]|uniref:THAP-type domain-containing protein n=1 Tax=Pyrocoelia pectoralis TaxID=417401 RepID=A0AAN7V2U6_9COLE